VFVGHFGKDFDPWMLVDDTDESFLPLVGYRGARFSANI